eukprot:TRINITY_DN5363_c0_g1_i1.p1 TRINITY_DN5363_c0_g1~~TRINITY_DN5363_c0_g1_i1.p1  ORF type:complete len:113 (-),score=7.16 TRINITY_DN5363_c0_g1_i1:179-517(-)
MRAMTMPWRCMAALKNGVGIEQDYARGTQLLEHSKDPVARAMCLIWGIGVCEDASIGFAILSMECDPSDPHVQCMLGICCQCGYGCFYNMAQAIQCYERAGADMFGRDFCLR